jgi:hypothetical protein
MTYRESLDREIRAQGQIIKDDQAGLRSRETSSGDRILPRLQIGIRKVIAERLVRKRGNLRSD